MGKTRIVALLSLLPLPIAGGTAVLGQQGRFGDVTEVLVVEVPVQVLKNGEPVRDLTADDFEILDGRKKQPIVGFEVVDLQVVTAPRELPVAARRHFLFFFDLSFSDPANILRARQAAKRLAETSLHPTDLAAVASYSQSYGIQIPLAFTPDRRQLAMAIDSLGLPQPTESRRDPLGLILSESSLPARVAGTGGGSSLIGVDADAEIEGVVQSLDTTSRRAADRNAILALTGSLSEFAALLRSVEGRKNVLFLSEGFNSSVVLGSGRGVSEEERQAIEAQNEAAVRGEIWDVDSNVRFGDTSAQNQLDLMLTEFVRADCAIQTIDIGGLDAAADLATGSQGEDGLFMMADSTGGGFYRNYNDLTAAMEEMLEQSSVTYLLAFQPENLEYDGKFHRLKVRLKKDAKGVELVHRPGYFAPRFPGEMSAQERQLSTASRLMDAPGGQVDTAVLAAAFDVGQVQAYVPVLIEIEGNSLLAGQHEGVVPAEIYAYAIDDGGRVQDFFTQALALDLAKVEQGLRQSGLKFWGQFDLPPGRYSVRAMVRKGSTGAAGVDVFPLGVPDLDQAESALMAPLFPEPAGKWLLAKEQGAQRTEYPYPFMLDNEPFIPASQPVVRAGESTRISLVTYNFDALSPEVEAAVFTLDGVHVGDADVRLQGRVPGESASLVRFVATLDLPDLTAGSYRLELTLKEPELGREASSSIRLRIAG